MSTPQDLFEALQNQHEATQTLTLNHLFDLDPQRGERMQVTWEGVRFDYSKQRIDSTTLNLLFQYAEACQVECWMQRMVAGEKINSSEQRPVLHLRQRLSPDQQTESEKESWRRLIEWVSALHAGKRVGATGRPFRKVVNIGIGGSSVGPQMVIEALSLEQPKRLEPFFLTTLDVAARRALFEQLNPEETLFLVVSKSFGTQESLINANYAKRWISEQLGEEAVASHFAALSASPEKMSDFGLPEEHCLTFPDGVGGRYSLWSPAGALIALVLGVETFTQLRKGAELTDDHFLTAPPEENIPLLMALIGYWNRSLLGSSALAIAAYSQALSGFIPWLQQLEMESNGKQVTRSGKMLTQPAAPVIFGGVGTDIQHTFFQMLHQGLEVIPVDFIALATPEGGLGDSKADIQDHQLLLANCFAQSQALMRGRTAEDKARHFSGNRPSSTLLLDRLTPQRLGQLLALYEHKVFVQGCLWQVNAFDQWGVELGKELALTLADHWCYVSEGEVATPSLDSSTQALMKQACRWMG
jgi:glucose-6-phosphate isomerase